MSRSSWWEVACGEESAGEVSGGEAQSHPHGGWRKHLVFPTLVHLGSLAVRKEGWEVMGGNSLSGASTPAPLGGFGALWPIALRKLEQP